MPFIGREKPSRAECTDPLFRHLNICPTPWWTFLIREYMVWKCPKCGNSYRLEWHSAGADGTKSWARYGERK